MASLHTVSVLQTPPRNTYSLLVRTEASSTPEALSHLRRKFSELEGRPAVEMESPLSAKRIRYLDAGSDVLQGHFQAARSLLETVDFLKTEVENIKGGFAGLAAKHEALVVEHETLRGDFVALTDKHEALGAKHKALTAKHEALVVEHETLRGDFVALTDKHEALTAKHEALVAEHETLRGDFVALTDKHEALVVTHETLLIQHETLRGDFVALTAKHEALTAKHGALASEHEALKGNFAVIEKTFYIICRGEIINAVMVVLGYTSTSGFSRQGFFKQLEKNFFSVFSFIRQTLPDRTEDEVRSMLTVINPSHENCYTNGRNAAAHGITLEEARKSAAAEDKPYLLMWVNYLAAFEKDQHARVSDIAFKNAFQPTSQAVVRYEMDSMVEALMGAPHEVQLNFGKNISYFLDLHAKQQKLDQEKDDDAIMEAGGLEFVDSE